MRAPQTLEEFVSVTAENWWDGSDVLSQQPRLIPEKIQLPKFEESEILKMERKYKV